MDEGEGVEEVEEASEDEVAVGAGPFSRLVVVQRIDCSRCTR